MGNNNDKGWTYSFVYSLREIRDVYKVVCLFSECSLSELFHKVKIFVQPDGKDWTMRRVQEILNSLINFGLINNKNSCLLTVFVDSEINSVLSTSDKEFFKQIFFSYPRFKDFIKLFIDKAVPLDNENLGVIEEKLKNISHVVCAMSASGKYTDSFYFKGESVYLLEKDKLKMRFWDVFVKWGRVLDVFEKFSVPEKQIINIADIRGEYKSVSVCYFVSDIDYKVNADEIRRLGFYSNYIAISDLVSTIAIEKRLPLDKVKKLVVDFFLENRDKVTVQRTSEIFIEGKYKILFPLFNHSFVSHLLIKK